MFSMIGNVQGLSGLVMIHVVGVPQNYGLCENLWWFQDSDRNLVKLNVVNMMLTLFKLEKLRIWLLPPPTIPLCVVKTKCM